MDGWNDQGHHRADGNLHKRQRQPRHDLAQHRRPDHAGQHDERQFQNRHARLLPLADAGDALPSRLLAFSLLTLDALHYAEQRRAAPPSRRTRHGPVTAPSNLPLGKSPDAPFGKKRLAAFRAL